MLINVGVLLDTMRQIETFLLQRHYDGFLRKGRIRSRSSMGGSVGALGDAADSKTVGVLWFWVGLILAIGLIAGTINHFSQKP